MSCGGKVVGRPQLAECMGVLVYLFLGLELGVDKTVAVEKLVDASPALVVGDCLCVDHSGGGVYGEWLVG